MEEGTVLLQTENYTQNYNQTAMVRTGHQTKPLTIERRDRTGYTVDHIHERWPKSEHLTYTGDTFTIVSIHPIYGHTNSKRTYKILQKAVPKIIYTTN